MASVFINEINYQNAGDDVNEFVEIAGVAGTILTDWSIVLYNSDGTVNNTFGFNDGKTIPNVDDRGYGIVAVITPGIPEEADGNAIALVDGEGNVVQFLSYGSPNPITATEGGSSLRSNRSSRTIQYSYFP